MSFKVIDLQQGSDEWRKWRSQGVGASDAPVIMGENPWKGVSQLLKDKCSGRNFQNEAMRRGQEMEPEARRAFEEKFQITLTPLCLQSTDYEWLRASVDGMTQTYDRVIEIKCGRKSYSQTLASQRVQDYYYGQLQHILAVTKLDEIDYWCYQPGLTPVHLCVPRNNEYIERMLIAEASFVVRLEQYRRSIDLSPSAVLARRAKAAAPSRSQKVVSQREPAQISAQAKPHKKDSRGEPAPMYTMYSGGVTNRDTLMGEPDTISNAS